ncbi:MAG: YncE family protein, partial [Ferrovibrionaceae bacterium]
MRHAITVLSTLLLAAAPVAAETLLIGNKGEDTLSLVALDTGAEVARLPTGKMPHEIAISPDGKQAAVVAYGATTIDVFDVAERKKLRTIDLSPNQRPHGLVWLSDGRLVATAEASQSVAVVAPDGAVTSIATGQQGTHMIVVAPDNRTAYTANIASGTVS